MTGCFVLAGSAFNVYDKDEWEKYAAAGGENAGAPPPEPHGSSIVDCSVLEKVTKAQKPEIIAKVAKAKLILEGEGLLGGGTATYCFDTEELRDCFALALENMVEGREWHAAARSAPPPLEAAASTQAKAKGLEFFSAEDLAEPEPEPDLAEPEPEPESALTEEEKKELNAALTKAAEAGDVEAVRRGLRDGADPNAADQEATKYGNTALIGAAKRDQVGCMEVLSEAGAALDKANAVGRTPLIIAAMDARTAAVEWLLGRGADWRLTDKWDGKTALDWAQSNAWKGEGNSAAAAALEAWIAEHGSAEEKKEMLSAALIKAATAGDAEAVVRCLRDGADPNAADENGSTVLYKAADQNCVGCMEVLGEAGADLDKADGDGMTPLMAAAAAAELPGGFHCTAAVEWLLGRGADWRLTRHDGKTALDVAKEYGEAEAAAALEAWIAEHGSAEEAAAAKLTEEDKIEMQMIRDEEDDDAW